MATSVKKLVLPPALGSYAFLFKPRDPMEGGDGKPKYTIVLIWPKKDIEKLKELKQAILDTAKAKFGGMLLDKEGKNAILHPDTKQPLTIADLFKMGKLKHPLRDGNIDRADDKVFADCVFVTASSERQPGLVDKNVQPIIDDSEAYSGCTFRASVALFAYDTKGNKGVAVGLRNLQVVTKGQRLDGRKSAEEDFKAFAESADEGSGKDAAAGSDLI